LAWLGQSLVEDDGDPEETHLDALTILYKMTEQRQCHRMTLRDAVDEIVVQCVLKTGKPDDLLSTGVWALDDCLVIRPGRVVVLAGATSSGKTALALQIAERVADAGKRGMFFSYEMSSLELATRLLAAKASVPVTRLELGSLTKEERERIQKIAKDSMTDRLLLVEASGMTMLDIRSRAMQEKIQHGLDFVVIDYLQLVTPNGKGASREREVAEMSWQTKTLARTLPVPVFLLSQLSRRHIHEKRPPDLHDCRESGAVEQDADIVLAIHRDAQESDTIRILKQRQGPIGVVRVLFDEIRMRFSGYDRSREEPW